MGITLSSSRPLDQLGTRFDVCNVVLRYPIGNRGLALESVENALDLGAH